MEVQEIHRGDGAYPQTLPLCLGDKAPEKLSAVGNVELLKTQPLALFCSRKCPGNLILQTYDLAQNLREESTAVVGGFHSPVESECLTILLRGKNAIIICVARGIGRMRIPTGYRKPLDEGRLLVLSPFSVKQRRATSAIAELRNSVVAALADAVFVAHAEPESKTEALCRDIVAWKKPLYTFADESNANLFAVGARFGFRP